MAKPSAVELRGFAELKATLNRMTSVQALRAVQGPMLREGTKVMSRSLGLVPRDRAILAGSHSVQMRIDGNKILVILGYNTPYAYSVHKNPRAGRTGGIGPHGQRYKHWAKVGQWHYLSQPMDEARPVVWHNIAMEVGRWLQSR